MVEKEVHRISAHAESASSEEEGARLLFSRPWEFVCGLARVEDLPAGGEAVEVAFAGRSNVGKSSLINALTGQGALARTSRTPGRTQELNLFTAAHAPHVRLVDMPGYGYAEAPKQKIELWNRLIRDYLRGRLNLARVYVLIDARHGIKKNDEEVFDLLDRSAVSYQLVLTKADKVKANDLTHCLEAARKKIAKRPAAHPDILITSAVKGEGIAALRLALWRLLRERQPREAAKA